MKKIKKESKLLFEGLSFICGILATFFFLQFKSPKFKIGQTVTNGYCTGVIGNRVNDSYAIVGSVCSNVFFGNLVITESELTLVK